MRGWEVLAVALVRAKEMKVWGAWVMVRGLGEVVLVRGMQQAWGLGTAVVRLARGWAWVLAVGKRQHKRITKPKSAGCM